MVGNASKIVPGSLKLVPLLQVCSKVTQNSPKVVAIWLKQAPRRVESAEVGTRIAQIGANMVARWPRLMPVWLHGSPGARQIGPKRFKADSKMGEVRLKTAQSEPKLPPSGP